MGTGVRMKRGQTGNPMEVPVAARPHVSTQLATLEPVERRDVADAAPSCP